MSGPIRDALWRFARGDTPAVEFEAWFYANHEDPRLEAALGPELVFTLLETRYGSAEHVYSARSALYAQLLRSGPLKCRCPTWHDSEVLPVGFDEMNGQTALLEDYFCHLVLARRTPWLDCVRCRECGQAWYLATDTRADEYRLVRLDETAVSNIMRGVWPTMFDDWEAAWPDKEWLAAFGYDSLDDYLAQHPPDPQTQQAGGHDGQE